MRIAAVPALPGIRLYAAHPGSGLRRLAAGQGDDAPPPYWAYQWAGGLALARHFHARPETVAGRRVLDLGAGSGLVGIAAMTAGARSVIAAEIDANAVAAIGLNAALNGVALTVLADDLLGGPPPAVDLVAAGDVFYDAGLAGRVTGFLDRCLAAGVAVLVGDPGRSGLPRQRLRPVAEYDVADVGLASGTGTVPGAVYAFVA
ncbi:50S ribosomal protein L11 methyltransferase [Aminobacter sp. Piv2-1]|uniref:class I SAM-dependent methyltransferase n=1 Tax=Aminobacter sp. Piv2-1 TaxID=3031122 RepID=UPI0030B207D3